MTEKVVDRIVESWLTQDPEYLDFVEALPDEYATEEFLDDDKWMEHIFDLALERYKQIQEAFTKGKI